MPSTFNERPHQNEKAEALEYISKLIDDAREKSDNEAIPKLENLLRLVNGKRYGLVWEEHAELVDEKMKTEIPVFVEDETKKIVGNPDSEDYNFLLEGDNLHSLHLLQKTHAGKIDVIYIDPPYNTGNKDFIYNDKIVDKNDTFSHSKWLSFMNKRLEIAKDLLSESGVIFISIDDNEQAQLKLLCDEIFGENQFLAKMIWQSTPGSNTGSEIKTVTEYVFVYAKNKAECTTLARTVQEDLKKYKLEDEYIKRRGRYTLNKLDRRMTGGHYSESLNYPIILPTGEKLYAGGLSKKQEHWNWRWSKNKVEWVIKNGFIVFKKSSKGWSIYFKQYFRVNNNDELIERTVPYQNLIKEEKMNSATGTKEVMDVLGRKVFDYPKPMNLLKYLVAIHANKSGIVLDFFAGSGTTGHAVEQLNKEDGGNRKYILCTNNENNICEEVTYKRLKNIQDELPHNLKYFKTKFVSKDDENLEYTLLNNVKTLIELEHGIDLEESDKATAFTLSEIRDLDLTGIRTVYVRQHSHAMMEKEDLARFKDIELVDVPEYYFAKEMREAGL